MLSYMKSKSGQPFKNKKELILAAILSIVLILGSSVKTPISSVLEVFEPAQEAWYTKNDEPPFEDAQGLPLKLLVKLDMIDKEDLQKGFKINNVVFESLDESLEDIADRNKISSKKLYEMIKKKNNENIISGG